MDDIKVGEDVEILFFGNKIGSGEIVKVIKLPDHDNISIYTVERENGFQLTVHKKDVFKVDVR